MSPQGSDGLCWKDLLRIKSPHKLLYALEIIEALGKPNRRIHRESTVCARTYKHTHTHTRTHGYLGHQNCTRQGAVEQAAKRLTKLLLAAVPVQVDPQLPADVVLHTRVLLIVESV